MERIAIAALFLVNVCLNGTAVSAQDLTAQQANEEIEVLYAAIVERHPDPYWFNDQSLWEDEMARLRARSGPISHVTQFFDMSRLMSLATDTHVQVYPGASTPGFDRSYPLRFRLFEGGLYVAAADDPYRDWVGQRVVSIAGVSAEDVVGTLADYSFSDHPARKRTWGVEYLLPHPAVYQYLGWANADGTVSVELEDQSGNLSGRQLSEAPAPGYLDVLNSGTAGGYYWPEGWTTLDDLAVSEVPMYRQHLDQNYWYSDLEGGRVVYIQVNSPTNQEGGATFNEFVLSLFSDIAERDTLPEQYIVDIRHNLGGWIHLALPIGYLIQATDTCCRRGSVVVLTSRETISAGSVFAGSMEQATRAVFIGEPTGGRPNIFLGHGIVEMPYSGIEPEVSSDFYLSTDTTDSRMFVAPDVLVPEGVADIVAGRDPALEAALNLTQEEAESFYPGDTPSQPWTRPSQAGAYQ